MYKNKLILYNDTHFFNHIKDAVSHFNLPYKTILFIEPYGASQSLLKRAIARKFNIIILTANTDLRIVPDYLISQVQFAVQIDTMNADLIIQFAQLINQYTKIDAVIPGFEYFVPIAAQVSHCLGTASIAIQDVLKVRRKDLMRLVLQENHCEIPRFSIVKNTTELSASLKQIKFPAVCKPVDAAGSVNVKKVNNQLEALEAATRILEGNDILWGYQLTNQLLIEEYIEGNEFSLEGIVHNGHIIHFSMTEKFVADQLEFVEIGHIVNTRIDRSIKTRVEKYVESIIKTLNMNHCPFHAEIRITPEGKPILMEIAARLAGDKIGDLIGISRNINYFDAILAVYLNEDYTLQKMDDTYAGIRFFYRPHIESYSSINGVDSAKSYPIEEINFYYQPRQFIPAFPKPLRRLGHVIIKGYDYDDLVNKLDEIDKQIEFIH